MEGCGFRDLYAEFQKANAEILGVSFDTAAENAAFAEKFDYPFPLLCDTKREIGLAYGACDAPDAETARRISYWIGPDGRIRRAYGSVAPAEHPRQVLQDVESEAA
jgi:thioredoxin-dependent peroxiredoxin